MWPGALLVPLPSAAALSGEHIKSAPHCVCDAAAAAPAVLSPATLAHSAAALTADIVARARAPQRCAPAEREKCGRKIGPNWSGASAEALRHAALRPVPTR